MRVGIKEIICAFIVPLIMYIYMNGFLLNNKSPNIVTGRNMAEYKNIYSSNLSAWECRRPLMELWTPDIRKAFGKPEPLRCSETEADWVYVFRGRIYISEAVAKQRGHIHCEYRPVVRNNDFSDFLGKSMPFTNNSKLPSDFFKVKCNSTNGSTYVNLHAGVKVKRDDVPKNKPVDGTSTTGKNEHPMNLNVLMFGFDSTSRLNWMRNLPKSYEYFTKILGGVTLEGYNVVGDGTTAAILPLLSGTTERELHEARRGFAGAKPVDDFPWIWNDFRNRGYATQFGEDRPTIGTFTYRLLGFQDQPVDHYIRHYYRQTEGKYNKKDKDRCIGSRSRLDVMLDWIVDFFEAYGPSIPKFSFLFHAAYSHGSFFHLQLADDPVTQFLKNLKSSGHLNNTLLILMSDHGARFTDIRKLPQGKFEQRLPYFGLRLPEWFEKKYPQAMSNLKNNAKALTTAFDIHATFKDLMNYTDRGAVPDYNSSHSRGISLFQAISENRTCGQAGIDPHWCTCLDWQNTSTSDIGVIAAARELIKTIDTMTEAHRHLCSQLSLDTIDAAEKLVPSKLLSDFVKHKDPHGAVKNSGLNETELFRITVHTKPNEAIYEATVTHELTGKRRFLVKTTEIARLTKYGRQPHCVMDQLPHLRMFCYCNQQ